MPRPATVVPMLGWRPSASAENAPKGLPVTELFAQVIRFVWSAPGIAPKTKSNRQRTAELARALPDHPTPVDVMAWVESLRAQFAPGTADLHLRALSAAYRYGADLGLSQGNPARFVPRLRRDGDPRPIVNIVQLWPTLLDACETPRERLWLALLRFTGIRRGEALGLWHDDVNIHAAGWRIEVVRQRPDPNKLDHTKPKTASSARELPVREPLRPFLAAVLAEGPPTVRCGLGGGERRTVPYLCPFRETDLTKLGDRLREVAPLAFPRGKKMWHALRDTLSMEMRQGGKTTAQISEVLGHTSEYVTRTHYLGVFGKAVHAASFDGLDADHAAERARVVARYLEPGPPPGAGPPRDVGRRVESGTATVGAVAAPRRSKAAHTDANQENTRCHTSTTKERSTARPAGGTGARRAATPATRSGGSSTRTPPVLALPSRSAGGSPSPSPTPAPKRPASSRPPQRALPGMAVQPVTTRPPRRR